MRQTGSVVRAYARALALAAVLAGGAITLAPGDAQDFGQYAAPDQSAQDVQDSGQDQAPQYDPPARVARLADAEGTVSFAPAGQDDWSAAEVNRPVVLGDRLYTDQQSRGAIELGEASIRLAAGTGFSFLNLDDSTAQMQLSSGSLNLVVREVQSGQSYEVDTPTLAFVVNQPGEYRLDVSPSGVSTSVEVFGGGGTVYGEGGVSQPVEAQQYYRFFNSQLSAVASGPLRDPDDFDQWCFQQDARYSRVVQEDYVSPDAVGAEDLDDYGTWQSTPDYGVAWFPQVSAADWAPYRYGYWAWIDPWGWTWVDQAPWGFAPFHYGRWVRVGRRWAWLPGAVAARPVYAPALVVFFGLGSGGPVGWVPLGPRDLYAPPYRVSRQYFQRLNRGDVYLEQARIDNAYTKLAVNHNPASLDYMYRGTPEAATLVSHAAFVGAQPVNSARQGGDAAQLARAQLSLRSPAPPSLQSQALRPAAASRPAAAAVFSRPLLVHSAPPAAPPPFSARMPLIQRDGGTPLGLPQLHRLGAATPIAAAPKLISTRTSPAGRPSVPSRPGQPGAAMPGAVQQPRFGQPQEPPAPQQQPRLEEPQVFQHQPMTTYTPPSQYRAPSAPRSKTPLPAAPQFRPPAEAPQVESHPQPAVEPRPAPMVEERPQSEPAPPAPQVEPRPVTPPPAKTHTTQKAATHVTPR